MVALVDNLAGPTELSTAGRLDNARVLLIFAKQPRPGQVKTRLTPPLTAHQAMIFYALSQRETVQRLRHGNYQTVLCYSGQREYFSQRYPQLSLCAQGQGDLGQRLQAAFAEQFARGAQRVCVVGTDSPDLPVAWIDEAFEHLDQCDILTIPAQDGGYVLAAARRPCAAIFTGIDWSTAQVLAQTRQRATAAGYHYAQLHHWSDVDDLDSLQRYAGGKHHSPSACYARRCLRRQVPGIDLPLLFTDN